MRRRRTPPIGRLGWRGKLLLLLLILMIGGGYLLMRLQPVVLTYAENTAQDYTTEWISRIVEDEIYKNRSEYESLVQLDHDNESHVTALRTDIIAMNRMKAKIVDLLSLQTKTLEQSKMDIPLGSIIAPTLRGGMGPSLHIGIAGLSTVKAEFASSFKSAGINQTRHNIVLEIRTQVDVLTVLGSKTVDVDASFYVTDTVIVGTVPDQYTYIDDTEQGLLGKINDYQNDH